MAMWKAMRQMPAQAGRSGARRGESAQEPGSDEALRPRHDAENTGPGLLSAVLARENMQQAWKRVRANKGAAGIDGLDIDQTAERLRTEWPGDPGTVVAWNVSAPAGTAGNDPQAGRRRARAWHPDGDGSSDSASVVAGVAADA